MVGEATINRTVFNRLFANTLDAISSNDLGRIFKDVVGSRRGSRAVSVWAKGNGVGLNEMSIDTGYTVECHGAFRFSQGEGCMELSVDFANESDSVGIIRLATRGGVAVPAAEMDKHIRAVAKALDMALRDKLPPTRLVPPPIVPYRPWAAASGDRRAYGMKPSELVALSTKLGPVTLTASEDRPYDRHADAREIAELFSQLRAAMDSQERA